MTTKLKFVQTLHDYAILLTDNRTLNVYDFASRNLNLEKYRLTLIEMYTDALENKVDDTVDIREISEKVGDNYYTVMLRVDGEYSIEVVGPGSKIITGKHAGSRAKFTNQYPFYEPVPPGRESNND